MDKSLVAFLIVGVLLVGCFVFLQAPVESIPPTNAFQIINTTTGNVTASAYNGMVTFLNGSGIIITTDYSLGTITFTSASTGGGGENNTASNLSPGTGLFYQKSGVDLQFKSLDGGSNITITSNDTSVIISGTSSSGGSAGLFLISANETDQTVTILNSDTIVRTYSLANNTYSRIIVESEVEVSFGVLSIPQDILIKIKNGGSTQETVTAHTLAQIGTSAVPIKVSFAQTGSSTITITQSGITSDANTNVLVHSIRIYGVT